MSAYNRRNNNAFDFREYLVQFERRTEQQYEKMEARLAAERKESEARQNAMEARLAADRKESEARLAEDRKESEARLATDRKESEARQKAMEERLVSNRNWLMATFFTVLFGLTGIFAAILIAV